MTRRQPYRFGDTRRPATSNVNTRHDKNTSNLCRLPLPCLGINNIVEDNASPHNNTTIREIHTQHGVNIVGYTATEDEKEEIRELIRQQCTHYRRDQDRKAQMTKQTRELDRLPSWPPNSPDLNLIEIVWSWMVKGIRDSDDGWPSDPELLK